MGDIHHNSGPASTALTKSCSLTSLRYGSMDPSVDTRVTLWNTTTKRKIAGKAAPMEKNLQDYLQKHPECELYNGQDKLLSPEEKRDLIAAQNRISIWNTDIQKRISGNAAPTERKLAEYLRVADAIGRGE